MYWLYNVLLRNDEFRSLFSTARSSLGREFMWSITCLYSSNVELVSKRAAIDKGNRTKGTPDCFENLMNGMGSFSFGTPDVSNLTPELNCQIHAS